MAITDTNIPGATPPSPGAAARAIDLVKTYGSGEARVDALDGVTVDFDQGAVHRGHGAVRVGQVDADALHGRARRPDLGPGVRRRRGDRALDDNGLTRLRRDRIGFVFQSFNLVPTLTAKENILLPADLAGHDIDEAWFDYLVDQLGIRDRLGHLPKEMSGGQQQRIACARALVGRPDLVFADEPTGNLDSNASAEVLGFLRRSVDEFGQTIAMVTHDPRGAAHADRVVFLADGRVVADMASPTADAILEQMKALST